MSTDLPPGVDPVDIPVAEIPVPNEPVPTAPFEPPTALNVPAPAAVPSSPIVARPGQYYRNTRYLMTAVTILMGFWFLYDGFVRYPAENAQIEALDKQQRDARSRGDDAEQARIGTELHQHVSHSRTDLFVQRVLAFTLPPIGILLLLWAIYNSRGEYRLSDDTLYIPGHPPVPLSAIRELDETQWDRKGIAYARYATAAAASGRLRLDDFVYERKPTDEIVDRIRKSIQQPLPSNELEKIPVT